MRPAVAAVPVALAALVLAGVAAAAAPSVVLLEWQEGRFAAGAPAGVEGVNRAAWAVAVDACHRRLYADVLYAPAEAGVDAGVAAVGTPFAMRVTVAGDNWSVSARVLWSGHGHFVGEAPAAGNATASLALESGAGVEWAFRLRGWEVAGEPACGGESEAS